MKIVFTKHAHRKLKFLKKLGWDFKRQDIKTALKNSFTVQSGYSDTKVSLSSISKTHNLRLVYSDRGGIITLITFYPVEKGRYEKK